jgi:hypothetical protein
MPSVVMPSVVMPSVVMPSVVMLSVVTEMSRFCWFVKRMTIHSKIFFWSRNVESPRKLFTVVIKSLPQ